MKNRTPFFIGLFIFLIIGSCKYKETDVMVASDPCTDGSPHCCENGNIAPCCDALPLPVSCNPSPTFKKYSKKFTITSDGINCSSMEIRNAVELPNKEGYLIAGTCFDNSNNRGMLLHVDLDGNVVCHEVDHFFKNEANLFYGVNLDNDSIPIITGFTRESVNPNASVYNFVSDNNYCGESDSDILDGGIGADFDWDNGRYILPKESGNSLIIGGKWNGVPALMEVANTNDIGDMVNFFKYDEDIFASYNIVLDQTSAHDIEKVVQTGDGGFLIAGHVDVIENGVTKKKGLFIKTNNSNFAPDFLKVFPDPNDMNSPSGLKNEAWALNTIQILDGKYFVLVGYHHDGDNNPMNRDGFILTIDALTGEYVDFLTLSGGNDENTIFGITEMNPPSGSNLLVTGIETILSSGIKQLVSFDYNVSMTGEISTTTSFPDINASLTDRNISGKDVIKTNDGGYFIVGEVRNGATRVGVQIIKTDPDGNF